MEDKQIGKKILVVLAGIFVASLFLRVALPYNHVFTDSGVIFRGSDAWYHMRLAENMAHNFPWPMLYDSYTLFPQGMTVVAPPLTTWLIAGIGYAISLGQPTTHTLQIVGAWLPPVLGTLTLIPVYFIGKELRSRWAGVIAAALVAFLPTEFFSGSMLGFVSHHVLETLLAATTVLFLIRGYKRERLGYYALAGLALGLYFLTWHGAIFTLFVFWLWLIVQFAVDYHDGRDIASLRSGATITACVALFVYSPYHLDTGGPVVVILALIIAAATPQIFGFLSSRVNDTKLLVATAIAIIGMFMLAIWVVAMAVMWGRGPFVWTAGWVKFIFVTSTAFGTVAETKPLLPHAAILVYGANYLFFFVGIYLAIKDKQRPLLIVVWGILMLIAVSIQRRWDYHFVVPLSLLTAYFFLEIGNYIRKGVKSRLSLALCIILLFASTPASIKLAMSPSLITEDWYNTLVWLRENSPEPFDDPEAYYNLYVAREPEYGVLSWWDYGHWIIEVAHRVPVSNPFQQGAVEAAKFFVKGKEIDGVKYVIIDQEMVEGKFNAMLFWAGVDIEVKGVERAPEESAIVKLRNGELPGYRLVHRENTVEVFERVGMETNNS